MFAPVADHPATEEALVGAYRELADVSAGARERLAATGPRAADVVAAATRISDPTTQTLMPELFAAGRARGELALTRAELAAVAAPTRFVWGSDDRAQPPAAGRD